MVSTRGTENTTKEEINRDAPIRNIGDSNNQEENTAPRREDDKEKMEKKKKGIRSTVARYRRRNWKRRSKGMRTSTGNGEVTRLQPQTNIMLTEEFPLGCSCHCPLSTCGTRGIIRTGKPLSLTGDK